MCASISTTVEDLVGILFEKLAEVNPHRFIHFAESFEAHKQGVLDNCLSTVAHSFDSRLSLFSTMIMSLCFSHSMS
jgi:hypothetical protein